MSPALQVDSLPTELSEKPYSDLNGKEIQKRGDICICIADSLCCKAETDTATATAGFSHSVMSNSVTPWTRAHQASLSIGFSRQEY